MKLRLGGLALMLCSLPVVDIRGDELLPPWLPENRSTGSFTTNDNVSDTVRGFETHFQRNQIDFRTSANGIGTTIRAVHADTVCVIKIGEEGDGGRTKVLISCTRDDHPTLDVAPISVRDPTPPLPTPQASAPQPKLPVPAAASYLVEYSITGPSQSVSITATNSAGGTEQHLVHVPFATSFYVRGRFFAYLSAQRQGGMGEIHVVVKANGRLIQNAHASSPYGIATASGRTE